MSLAASRRAILGAFMFAAAGLGGFLPMPSLAAEPARTPKEQAVVDLLKVFETGDLTRLNVINPDKYIQHNLDAADGVAGLKGFIAAMPKGAVKGETLRVFQDGDYVFTHGTAEMGDAKFVVFDVFRFEGDKIVEHWDNLQPMAPANPSGHTMIDGPTEARDLDKTDANKALVKNFVSDVLVGGKLDAFASYVDGEKYTQHNPMFGDGVKAVVEGFKGAAAAGVVIRYDVIHKVLGKGDFVLVMSEGSISGKPTAFYDMFRVEAGKVAEHWDVVTSIPPKGEWKNANGKF
jgi:predicted SnoaL-like aldol condensation-catalyzing enzyme